MAASNKRTNMSSSDTSQIDTTIRSKSRSPATKPLKVRRLRPPDLWLLKSMKFYAIPLFIVIIGHVCLNDTADAPSGVGPVVPVTSGVGRIAQSNREVEKQIVDRILGEGYDKRIRPAGSIKNRTIDTSKKGTDGPTIVRVNTLVRSISKIDDVTMEYSVQLSLRQEWTDDRLAFSRLPTYESLGLNSITLTEQERLWKPDLFFRNEKEGHFHKIIMPNVLLRINGDGSVLYSIRISLVLACPMDLKYYPLDKQNCTIEMASYGYLDEDLKFVWKEKNPVQIAKPLNLPRFTLETYDTAYCTSRTTTGAYSCLRIDLIFKREFSYYLIQIYIPCCMLVIVSWVSFWLDPNAIPARVSLGVTTLLTMATQISGINASLPPVSYTKAIDVWTGVCLTFVFGALLEFALVNYASRSDQHRREMLTNLTQSQQLRWRKAIAAAAAAGVAPPTEPPPPDEDDIDIMASYHNSAMPDGIHQPGGWGQRDSRQSMGMQLHHQQQHPHHHHQQPQHQQQHQIHGGHHGHPMHTNHYAYQQRQSSQFNQPIQWVDADPASADDAHLLSNQLNASNNNSNASGASAVKQSGAESGKTNAISALSYPQMSRDGVGGGGGNGQTATGVYTASGLPVSPPPSSGAGGPQSSGVPANGRFSVHNGRASVHGTPSSATKANVKNDSSSNNNNNTNNNNNHSHTSSGCNSKSSLRARSCYATQPTGLHGGHTDHTDQHSGYPMKCPPGTRSCEIHSGEQRERQNKCKMWLNKFPTRSKRIDVISRIFFPLKFALFNLVYWTTYLFREGEG